MEWSMFKTRTFWAIVLSIMTSVLIFEAKLNVSGNSLWTRVTDVLVAPGARLVNALDLPAATSPLWVRLSVGIALTCNFVIYAFFWYACIWTTGYLRARRHPYDRQPTLLSH